MNLAGKVVVITGASRGLGYGMAQAMRGWGLQLGLCARTVPDLAGEGVVCASVDVTDRNQVEGFAVEVADRLGPADLWIHNAGVLAPVGFVRDLDPAELGRHWAVNVGGVLHGSQSYLAQLRAHRRPGVIVTISSGAASKPYAAWGAYCSGKAGAERLTEVIALEEAEHVRAHSIAPGVVDTDMQKLLRGLTPEQFPLVHKFKALKEAEAFNSPAFVAEWLLRVAFAPDAAAVALGFEGGLPVSLRLPDEPPAWTPSLVEARA